LTPAPRPAVHHCTVAEASDSLVDLQLMDSMDAAIRACSLGHSVRSASGVKVRQPLEKAIIFADAKLAEQMAPLEGLIKEELNVKRVEFGIDREALVEYKIRPLPRLLGAKHGRALPKILAAVGVHGPVRPRSPLQGRQERAAYHRRQGGRAAAYRGRGPVEAEAGASAWRRMRGWPSRSTST